MFEKVELEGNIGNIGKYSVDVKPNLNVAIMVGVEVPVIQYLKEAAAKTKNPIDDGAIAWVEKILSEKAALEAQSA